jgi:hypothetical protein
MPSKPLTKAHKALAYRRQHTHITLTRRFFSTIPSALPIIFTLSLPDSLIKSVLSFLSQKNHRDKSDKVELKYLIHMTHLIDSNPQTIKMLQIPCQQI